MSPFAEALCSNTLMALVPAGMALMAGYWRKPAVAHGLWMLVLLKLATPTMWRVGVLPAAEDVNGHNEQTVSMGRASPDRNESARAETGISAQPAMDSAPDDAAANAGAMVLSTGPGTRGGEQIEGSGGHSWKAQGGLGTFSMEEVGVAVWAAGSTLLAGIMIWRATRFARRLKEATAAQEADIANEVKTVAQRMGMRRVPEVRLVDADISPMVWFAGRGLFLILPRAMVARLRAADRAGILAHELAHVKRGDHWARLLEMAVTIGLWWHPLMWMARKGMRAAEEEACDAWVVWVMGDGRGYAKALVETLNLVAVPLGQPVCVSGLGRMGNMKRRLVMILDGVPKKAPVQGKWALFVAAVSLLPFVPTRGQTAGAPGAPGGATATPATKPDDATAEAVKALLELANDQTLAGSARTSIYRFGAKAVPALVDSLDNPNVTNAARELINALGPDSVDALVEAMGSAQSKGKVAILFTLQRIVSQQRPVTGMATPFGPALDFPAMQEKIKPVAQKALKDGDGHVRAGALSLWGELFRGGEHDDATLQPLIDGLKDPEIEARFAACTELGVFGSAGKTVPLLMKLLEDKDSAVRQAAATALARMGPEAKEATGALVKALKDSDMGVRSMAVEALGIINGTVETGGAMEGMAPRVVADTSGRIFVETGGGMGSMAPGFGVAPILVPVTIPQDAVVPPPVQPLVMPGAAESVVPTTAPPPAVVR